MDPVSFSVVLTWVLGHGYLLLFAALVVEGPLIASAAAFAAALGHFNIFIVAILAVLGNLIGDWVFYGLGYWGGPAVVEKYGARIGLNQIRMGKIENLLQTHFIKTLFLTKLAPLLSASGLVMAGVVRIKPYRFILVDFMLTVPHTLFFVIVGYYFGVAFESIFSYYKGFQYLLLLAIPLLFVPYIIERLASSKISKRMDTPPNNEL